MERIKEKGSERVKGRGQERSEPVFKRRMTERQKEGR